jgi:hypothetical protein
VATRPPAAFVVVSGFFLEGVSGYQKLDTWPVFEQWLNAHYTLAAERTPPHLVRWWGRPQPPPGYRLYVLKTRRRSVGNAVPLTGEIDPLTAIWRTSPDDLCRVFAGSGTLNVPP